MEISGRDFGFPLVAKLAILRHHATYRIPWHRHETPELLRTGSAPLTQVALDCGFSSSTYFSTVFRKHVGCTPHQWRASG